MADYEIHQKLTQQNSQYIVYALTNGQLPYESEIYSVK